MPKLLTQRVKKLMATVVAVAYVLHVTLINSKSQSVITAVHWLHLLVFGRGPRMLVVMD